MLGWVKLVWKESLCFVWLLGAGCCCRDCSVLARPTVRHHHLESGEGDCAVQMKEIELLLG